MITFYFLIVTCSSASFFYHLTGNCLCNNYALCKKNSGTTTCEKCEVIVCSAKCLKKHSGFHNSQRNKKLKKKFSFFSCFCAVNSRESNESDENATKSNYKEVKTNQLPNTSTNSASSTNSI